MSSTQRAATFLALAFALFASTVSANKGPNQQIIFTNETTSQIGVTPYGTSPAILAAVGAGSASAFQTAGGVVINGGGNFSSSFSVQAGTYTLLAADFNQPNSTGVGVASITESQTVAANQTVNVYIKPVPGAFPPITFSPTP
ncbi:MAG TPA: hypothetical protein VFI31_12385 [Pirellulales bacterium]|nr:hypothetical protein [Pirellulales bacterium]